jgi:hypothetical protein
MAKQHRMAALTFGCFAAPLERSIGPTHHSLQLTLVVVAAASLWRFVTQTLMIFSQIASRQT